METERKIQENRISCPTYSKGRHAACISITAVRTTHLWLFHCKLGLLGSLFYTTVITLSFYVFIKRCFFVCRNIKTMEVMWSKASNNPWNTDLLLIPQRYMWVLLLPLISMSKFIWLFHITTTSTESVINGDNKIKSMQGVCNLFNAQYSWVSARK